VWYQEMIGPLTAEWFQGCSNSIDMYRFLSHYRDYTPRPVFDALKTYQFLDTAMRQQVILYAISYLKGEANATENAPPLQTTRPLEDSIYWELMRGGRFVIFRYCFSIVILSIRRPSEIVFVPAGTKRRGGKWNTISLLFGWWGVPWGPIWTIQCVSENLSGGRDVTREILKITV